MPRQLIFLIFFPILLKAQTPLDKPFADCHVKGSITLYSEKNNSWIYSDEQDSRNYTRPASTFKIINALIALEEGVLRDEHQIIKFVGVENVDTVSYGNRPDIFKDLNLEEAFKKSAVWFNLEIAKKVGREKYKSYINKCDWGNKDLSEPGLDFWNKGPFGVTPIQQILFLEKLYKNELPFSHRNIEIVKRIMIDERNESYTMRGKTGWAQTQTEDIGWWVGYVEQTEGVFFFASRIRKSRADVNVDFLSCRKTITYDVMKQLQIIQ